MATGEAADEAPLAPEAARPRDHFLSWQCRLRQLAVRRFGGRPSPGMRPQVLMEDGRQAAPAITVLLHHREPAEATDMFRHIVRRTHDPKERYDRALKLLAAAHYQRPQAFSDAMTASFASDSDLAARLVAGGSCVLAFREDSTDCRVPCAIARLDEAAPAWQATYWHNAMFSPHLPGEITILSFTPDWTAAEIDPPPPKPAA